MYWGLALSGGGVKGTAHVGALMALEKAGLTPSMISGASAGAIVAGLYASGMSAVALAETLKDVQRVGGGWLDYDWPGMLKAGLQLMTHRPVTLSGLIKGDRLSKYLALQTRGITLTEARLPVCLTAVDINNARLMLFASKNIPCEPASTRVVTELPLYQGICASIAMPVIFQPRMAAGTRLVDGGVWENIPNIPSLRYGRDPRYSHQCRLCGSTRASGG